MGAGWYGIPWPTPAHRDEGLCDQDVNRRGWLLEASQENVRVDVNAVPNADQQVIGCRRQWTLCEKVEIVALALCHAAVDR